MPPSQSDPPVRPRLAVRTLLRGIRCFAKLSPEAIDALAAGATEVPYSAGATIFLEGDPAPGLFVLEDGVVKISRVSLEGREYIMHLVGPGESFNDVAAMDGGSNPGTAIAKTAVVVWKLSRSDLRRVAQRHPELVWAFVEDMASRARYLVGLVEDLAMRNVRGRLARLLLEEAEGTEHRTVPRMLTQEEMAARLGTVREMVGRTLRSMAASGVIEFDRHRIVILDPERLAEEAEV